MNSVWQVLHVSIVVGLFLVLAPFSGANAQLIRTKNIVNGAVTSAKIANSAVTATKIAPGAVTNGKIADGAITTDKIAIDTITVDKIAIGAVTEYGIAAGAVTSEKIAAGAITADKVATDAVTADGIAPESVSTEKIAFEAVTADKIAPEAVTEYGIAAGAVTADKIFPQSVFTDKIAAGAVTPDKLAFYRNIVIVAPTGGDFTNPVDALNAMPWDETCANRYLVKIMPGIYDIGEGYVQMRPCVDIEGSGMRTTLIKGTTSTLNAYGYLPGVVDGASHAELRDIAVLNEGATANSSAVVAVKVANRSGMTISRVSARATGSNINAGIGIVTKAFDLNPLDLEPVVIVDSEAYAGDHGTLGVAIIFMGTPATDITAGTEGLLHAIVKNTVATAKGATTSNAAIVFRNATATVIGGVADGEKAIQSDAGSGGSGGGGQVLGTLLRGNVLVKSNKAQQTPMLIANCATASGTTLTVDNGALIVTNSHLDHAAALLNSPTLTLMNSSLGGGVSMASGTLNAVNSSFAGDVAVTGGSANCAGVVRSDTFATLDSSCQ